MKKSILAVAIAIAFVSATPLAHADTTSTSTANGGAGGAGGSAAGGTATGGTSTNNISGVSSGGTGQGGAGGTAQGGTGGTAQASGGYVGSVSTGGSTASLGDVTVNLNQASAPMGKAGLGVGVDPTTGHIVTDNTVNYQGSYKVKNTPDVSVGGPASGPCNGFSGGIGVSMAGIGIGANASTVDEGCSARETARVAAMIGRMDVANAVLENLPIVQAAMKAKAAREASALPAQSLPAQSSGIPATTAPAHWPAAPVPVPAQSQEQRDAALKEQQRQAQEALQRQATMAKVNDTLKFTDATTQGNDKTPQEIMAEEANKKLAAKAEEAKKRQESLALAPQPSQQANRSDPPATGTPLALQQTIKPEIIAKAAESKNSPEPQPASPKPSARSDVPTKVVDAKVSPVALSAEERLKATKAALNLQ